MFLWICLLISSSSATLHLLVLVIICLFAWADRVNHYIRYLTAHVLFICGYDCWPLWKDKRYNKVMEAITTYLFYSLSVTLFHTLKRIPECVIAPPQLIEYFYRDNNNISDLWEHQEGLRKAIKKLLAGGNIPTRVVTLIYPAGLCITASQHLSLLPQPHPCCSEICTPIKRYCCLWCRVDKVAFCWICVSVCLFKCKSSLE